MYFTGMDSVTINQSGLSALKAEFDMIDGIKDAADIAKVTKIHNYSSSPMFGIYIGQDDKISNKYAVFILQGGSASLIATIILILTSALKAYVQHLYNTWRKCLC